MSSHKLTSPTNTYTAIPDVGELNKGLGKTQNPIQNRNLNKLSNLPGITASHNGVPLQQKKNLPSGTSWIINNPSRFNLQKSCQTISITRTPKNTNMRKGEGMEGVSNKAEDNSQRPARRDPPSGTALKNLPGTSTQSVASSQTQGEMTRGTSTQATTLDNDYVEDSDSDASDPLEFSYNPRKRIITSLRLPYTAKEDIAILKYVMLPDNISRTGSLSLWRELETQMGEPKRTYQSLKNRFLRNIKPHLLTTYRSRFSSGTLARIKRAFPDLKGRQPYNAVVEENVASSQRPVVNTAVRPVASGSQPHVVNPLPQNKQPTRVAERNKAPVEVGPPVDGGSSPSLLEDEVIQSSPPTPKPNSNSTKKVIRSPIRMPGVEELERRETDTESGGDPSSTAVELFVPKNPQNLPIASFHCAKILKELQDKTSLNVNIALLNDQSSSLLSGPVKVDVVVKVTPIQENTVEAEKTDVLRLEEVPNTPKSVEKKQLNPRRRKKKFNPPKRRIKVRPKKKAESRTYVLRLKKCNSKKLLNVTPEYKQRLAGLLQKIESNVKKGQEGRRSLRSQTRETSPDSKDDEVNGSSENWEASSDEKSDSEEDEEIAQFKQTWDNDIRMNLRRRPQEVSVEDNETRMNLRSRTREASPTVEPSKSNEEDRMNVRIPKQSSPEENGGRITLRSRTRGVDGQSQNSSQETTCSYEADSDYSQMYREVRKRYRVVTVEEKIESSVERDEGKKRQKMDEKQGINNILLKNMVGMLSPSSKVFSNQQSTSKTISKKL